MTSMLFSRRLCTLKHGQGMRRRKTTRRRRVKSRNRMKKEILPHQQMTHENGENRVKTVGTHFERASSLKYCMITRHTRRSCCHLQCVQSCVKHTFGFNRNNCSLRLFWRWYGSQYCGWSPLVLRMCHTQCLDVDSDSTYFRNSWHRHEMRIYSVTAAMALARISQHWRSIITPTSGLSHILTTAALIESWNQIWFYQMSRCKNAVVENRMASRNNESRKKRQEIFVLFSAA